MSSQENFVNSFAKAVEGFKSYYAGGEVQYRNAYSQAFKSAIKTVNPTWEYGDPIPFGALDGITRESVESQLVKSGNTFVKRSSVSGSSKDLQI